MIKAFALSLASVSIVYVLGSFALSMRWVDDLEQCQTDILQLAINRGQIGRLANLGGRCASVAATAAMAREFSR